MQVTFYGVRGSLPVCGPEYIKYGGHTACVHVELNDGTQFILDAGTGIKNLGDKLVRKDCDIHLLLTHNHWDHIQGFPFFSPIYQRGRNIFITPGMTTLDENEAILKQMSGSNFPVDYRNLPSNIEITPINSDTHKWNIGSATVSRFKMNHPGSGSAYKIEADGASVAYITDNELYPPYKKESDFLDWVSFAQGADLVIHDAQYVIEDMPAKSGWGHSIAEEAVKLALACKVKKLALYSHDHVRTDKEIEAIEEHCKTITEIVKDELNVFAAAEGMSLNLSP